MTCNNVILAQPEADSSVNYTIPEGDSARLNFTPDDISGLNVGANGELVISFEDGGQLTITNFDDLASSGNLIYMADGTLIDPSILTSSPQAPEAFTDLAAASGTNADPIIIAQPEAGTTQEVSMKAGQKYVCDFDPANAATVEVKDGQMVLTFADGSQVVINNYETAMAGELPAELTVADGTVVQSEELLTQVTEVAKPIEEILEFAQAEDEGVDVANIEPAAGEEVADVDMAALADSLADIETAAGEEGGTAGNSGYGFNSKPTDVPLNSPDAIGPLGPTQLAYRAPQFQPENIIFSPVEQDDIPTITFAEEFVDETNLASGALHVEGTINATYGNDTPGAITTTGQTQIAAPFGLTELTSNGNPIVITSTSDGYVATVNGETFFTFVIDPVSGDYVYEQFLPLDHPDSSDPNDTVSINLGIKATDADGDVSLSNVRITLADDGPIVLSQVAVVVDETNFDNGALTQTGQFNADVGQDVDGSYAGNNTFNATGSVDNGILTANGVPVIVTFDLTTNTYTGAANGVTIFTLVLDPATAEYTYSQFESLDHADVNDPDDILNLEFGITVTDFDGDTASGNVTVHVHDDGPVTGDDSNTIDESDTGAGPIVINDSVSVDFGNDGQGTLAPSGTFTSGGSQTNGQLSSNGVPVVVTQTANGYVGVANGVTVFSIEINSQTGDYTFTLFDSLDHADATDPNDVISLNFGTVITDYDGDTDLGQITINVNDDGPCAVDDAVCLDGEIGTGNVLTNDHVGADNPGTVIQITFEGTEYGIPANGQTTVQGNNGTLTIHSDGQYSYEATGGGTPPQTVHSFNLDNPPGSDNAGDIKNVSTEYNETTKDFTFSMTVEASADGIEFAVNDGPNPKNHPGELAFFYIDDTGATPVVTVYGYNGFNTSSWQDGSSDAGTQAPDKIFNSITNPEFFDNISVTIDANGDKVFSVSLDVTALQNHDPAYGPDGIWSGVDFGSEVGIWSHALSGLDTEYGADGFLTSFNHTGLSYYDSSNGQAETTIISGSGGGDDVFTYTMQDADGDTSTATLSIGAKVELAYDVYTVFEVDANHASGHQGDNFVTDDNGQIYHLEGGAEVHQDTNTDQGGMWYRLPVLTNDEGGNDMTISNVRAIGNLEQEVEIKISNDGQYILMRVGQDGNGSNSVVQLQYDVAGCNGHIETATVTVTIIDYNSPLIMDLDGDGIELLPIEAGVLFDIDNDGDLEQTGWAGADDGFLVLDKNNDGVVNDRSEMFGDTDTAADGFANLASYDSNNDGVIDANDDIFADLKVWQDADSNGVTDAGEMLTLEQIGVVSISLNAEQPDDLYIEGSWISDVSTYTTADGRTHQIVDAWFETSEVDTNHPDTGYITPQDQLNPVDSTGGILPPEGEELVSEIQDPAPWTATVDSDGNIVAQHGWADNAEATDGGFDDTLFDVIGESASTLLALDAAGDDILDISQMLESSDEVTEAIQDFVFTQEDSDIASSVNDNANVEAPQDNALTTATGLDDLAQAGSDQIII